MAHDPLEWAAIEWSISAIANAINEQVQQGTYRSQPIEEIRSAKGNGLTRPLASVNLTDWLLYKSIIAFIESEIETATRPWSSPPGEDDAEEPSYDFFQAWLLKDAERRRVIESGDYVVVTDVANFYPYISLDLLESRVLSSTSLDRDAISLMLSLLRGMSPLYSYRSAPAHGLPQENLKCSEILAHAYLQPLDDEFREEGSEGRYWRYSDDVVVSTGSAAEGRRIIDRFQRCIEPLGLYPNSTKTRILRSEDFIGELYYDVHDSIPDLIERYKSGNIALEDIENLINDHLSIEIRGVGWGRALRRYITLARVVRSRIFVSCWSELLLEDSSILRWVAEYLSTFSLDSIAAYEVCRVARNWSADADDVPILLYEALALAPNIDEPELRSFLGSTLLRDLHRFANARRDRVASAATVPFLKFACQDQLGQFAQLVHQRSLDCTKVTAQATPALMSLGLWPEEDTVGGVHNADQATRSLHALLQAIQDGDPLALRVAMGAMDPAEKQTPERMLIRPRTLFIAPLLTRLGYHPWPAFQRSLLVQLDRNHVELQDAAARRWISAVF